MSTISLLAPLNLAEEKKQFFASDSYNPQFRYDQSVDPELLKKWGLPKPELVALAKRILIERKDLFVNRLAVDPQILRQKAESLITAIGITEPIEISFDPTKVTRCSVKGTQIVFRDPAEFESIHEVEATFNHEFQTHLLRNLNQKKQGWKLDREHHDHQILRTEEGLAVLHSALAFTDVLLWRPASYYVAVWLGMQFSFRQMFNELKSLGFDDSFAWKLCVRIKRGFADTAQPGGNTKDLCYLDGALQMWQWLTQPQNKPTDLYIGKVYIEELDEKLTQLQTTDVYLPTFFADMNTYRQKISEIGKRNFFEEAV